MSARQVMLNKLHCDAIGCGAVYDHVATPVAHLRELAAADGWRHRQQPTGSNWMRAVDLCPTCPDDAAIEPVAARTRARRRR